jgi:hypothetical protein
MYFNSESLIVDKRNKIGQYDKFNETYLSSLEANVPHEVDFRYMYF